MDTKYVLDEDILYLSKKFADAISNFDPPDVVHRIYTQLYFMEQARRVYAAHQSGES